MVENFLRADDHVILIHATKDFKNLEPPMGEGAKKEWPEEAIKAYEAKVEEQARILTTQYTNHLLAENIKHEAHIVKGDPRTVILDMVEKYKPVAVILGSRGLGMIKRSFLGSVSDYILHNSSAPVIVVRENEESGK